MPTSKKQMEKLNKVKKAKAEELSKQAASGSESAKKKLKKLREKDQVSRLASPQELGGPYPPFALPGLKAANPTRGPARAPMREHARAPVSEGSASTLKIVLDKPQA